MLRSERKRKAQGTPVRARQAGASTAAAESASNELQGDGASKATYGFREREQDGSVDDLVSSLSALTMVPRSVRFGRRKGRAFVP